MSAPAERPSITPAYVDEMIEAAARATGFRLANDRFGFVPAVLRADRERCAAARGPSPEVAELREEIEDDRFARAFREAQRVAGVTGNMESYARVLSGRLRQMDKRAKAANTALVDLREQAKLDVALARAKTQVAEDRLAASEREKAAALGLLDGQASVIRKLERDLAAARADVVRVREAATEATHWHERADKALSKSGETGSDVKWRRSQHQEQAQALAAALNPQEPT